MTTQPGDHDGAAAIEGHAASGAPSRRRPADTFAVRLLLSRHLNGLTISEAAQRAEINDATWATWEAGRRPRDIIDVCGRISLALDIDFDWLLLGGPLAGPRGVPTERARRDTGGYPLLADRGSPAYPNGRPYSRSDSANHRRAVRTQLPVAA